jgi:hypothetical protein
MHLAPIHSGLNENEADCHVNEQALSEAEYMRVHVCLEYKRCTHHCSAICKPCLLSGRGSIKCGTPLLLIDLR